MILLPSLKWGKNDLAKRSIFYDLNFLTYNKNLSLIHCLPNVSIIGKFLMPPKKFPVNEKFFTLS